MLGQTPSFTHLEVSIEGISLRGRVPLERVRDRFRQLHGNADGVVGYYSGPRRYFLDTVLLNEAVRSGVEVRENMAVKGLLHDGDKVCGVRGVSADGASFEARAKIVIGADGRMSQFSDFVSAKKIAVREQSTFAYYGYFSGIDKPELAIHKRGRLGTAIALLTTRITGILSAMVPSATPTRRRSCNISMPSVATPITSTSLWRKLAIP